jgi:hypothetical protein
VPPTDGIDAEENLTLFCGECHRIVDKYPRIYSVEALAKIRADHEARLPPRSLQPPPPPLETGVACRCARLRTAGYGMDRDVAVLHGAEISEHLPRLAQALKPSLERNFKNISRRQHSTGAGIRPVAGSKYGANGAENAGSSSNASPRANSSGTAEPSGGQNRLPQRRLITYGEEHELAWRCAWPAAGDRLSRGAGGCGS